MRVLLIGLILVLAIGVTQAGDDLFPNMSNRGRYDIRDTIGVVKTWVSSNYDIANRSLRVPNKNKMPNGYNIAGYQGIVVDNSEISTGDFVITANFKRGYSHGGSGGSYISSSRRIPTINKSSIPFPPDADFVQFDIGAFTETTTTVSITLNMRMGENLGTTTSETVIEANTPTNLRIDDHYSFVITKGSGDVYLGRDNTVTKNSNSKILNSSYPSHTVKGTYDMWGVADTRTTVNGAEDY